MPEAPDLLTVATWLRDERGFSIVPVVAATKRPAIPWREFQTRHATNDELRQWFGNGSAYGLGIVTGAISKLVAVDVDSEGGKRWALAHLPATTMGTRTARGEHWFYRHPGGTIGNAVRIDTGDPEAKLDVRADGGFVVAPPTRHSSGAVYTRLGPWPAVDLLPVFDPNWIAAAETPQADPPATDETPSGPIPQGRRNDTLHRLGRALRARGIPDAAILATLQDINDRLCQPPLGAREIEALGRSVLGQGDRPDFATLESRKARRIVLTSAATIAIRPVHWLWDARLALGTVALAAGREGIGKSIVVTDRAAHLTRGTLPGVFFGTPKSVIVVATEDSWEHTITPRLMAAGADLERVFRADVVTHDGSFGRLNLPADLDLLEQSIQEADAGLVILDPLLSRLDAKLDTHKDSEVRQALEPLAALADRTRTVVLGLIHVNKSGSTDPLSTVMGSRAFAAVARSVLFCMVDPDDDARRLLGQPKNNLGRVDLPSLAFTIKPAKVADTPEGPVWTGMAVWLGEDSRSIRDALEAGAESVNRSATADAVEWLHGYLETHGCTDRATIVEAGRQAGHKAHTIKRAGGKLRIRIKSVGFPAKSYWSLPPASSQDSASQDNRGESVLTVLAVPTERQLEQLAQLEQSDGHGGRCAD